MCHYSKTKELVITDKDITVYKVVYKLDENRVISPYMNFYYLFNKLVEVPIEKIIFYVETVVDLKYVFQCLNFKEAFKFEFGIHSFTDLGEVVIF